MGVPPPNRAQAPPHAGSLLLSSLWAHSPATSSPSGFPPPAGRHILTLQPRTPTAPQPLPVGVTAHPQPCSLHRLPHSVKGPSSSQVLRPKAWDHFPRLPHPRPALQPPPLTASSQAQARRLPPGPGTLQWLHPHGARRSRTFSLSDSISTSPLPGWAPATQADTRSSAQKASDDTKLTRQSEDTETDLQENSYASFMTQIRGPNPLNTRARWYHSFCAPSASRALFHHHPHSISSPRLGVRIPPHQSTSAPHALWVTCRHTCPAPFYR